ncbi:MAG: hypothetical protein GPJ54_17540, partial [Candidatus Heimdallarchaeota archaeon]|nr:hypothetical protein [Candidatus Heimdallarchaeota archaeon]
MGFVTKIRSKLVVVLFTFLFLASTIDQAIAFTTAYNNEVISEVDEFSSYLNYKIDNDGNRHAIYLDGKDVPLEPSGDKYNDSHVLWYSALSVGKFEENASIDVSTSSVTEKVQITTRKVFPYNYNFQIDSDGKVHLAYISNYTLFYSVRTTDGVWTETQMNDNNDWFAYQPDIQLGENEEPRILYVAAYKSGASAYFGTQVSTSFRGVHYTLHNETGWFLYDTSMNNKPGATKSPGRFLVYNPGFLIEEGIVYAAYNVDSALASSSNVEFIRFSEFPDTEERERSYDENKFPKIYEASVRATNFRRPRIMSITDDIVMLIGTWTTGGGIIAYLSNSSLTPEVSSSASTEDQWDVFQIENNRRSLQIEGFTGIVDKGTGTVIGIYSTFHLFNEAEGQFNYDVLQLTFRPEDGLIGEVDYARATDTFNVRHTYPNIAFTPDGSIEIAFIRNDPDSTDNLRELLVGASARAISVQGGGELGMVFAILAVGGLLGGWVVFM